MNRWHHGIFLFREVMVYKHILKTNACFDCSETDVIVQSLFIQIKY